jgi:hypothetical protein
VLAYVISCTTVQMCTGLSGLCPADEVLNASVVCRPAAGVCDIAETVRARARVFVCVCVCMCDHTTAQCNGVSASCPPDVVADATRVCRAAGKFDVHVRACVRA